MRRAARIFFQKFFLARRGTIRQVETRDDRINSTKQIRAVKFEMRARACWRMREKLQHISGDLSIRAHDSCASLDVSGAREEPHAPCGDARARPVLRAAREQKLRARARARATFSLTSTIQSLSIIG